MKYNVGERVWINVSDEEHNCYYIGPGKIIRFIDSSFNYNNEVKIPLMINIGAKSLTNAIYVSDNEIEKV